MIESQVFRNTGSDLKYCGIADRGVVDLDYETRVWALFGFGPLNSRSTIDFSRLEPCQPIPNNYHPIAFPNV